MAGITVSEAEWRTYVARGAAVLDTLTPLWWQGVNPTALSIRDPDRCILHQVYGDYLDGINYVREHGDVDEDLVDLWGFACLPEEDTMVTRLWTDEIRTRVLDHAGGALVGGRIIGNRKADYALV